MGSAIGSAMVPLAEGSMQAMRGSMASIGQAMDDLPGPEELYNHSGLLRDIRYGIKRMGIKGKVVDRLFYDSLQELLEIHNSGSGADVIGPMQIMMVQHTLKGSFCYSSLPDVLKGIFSRGKLNKGTMMEILEALFSEFIMAAGEHSAKVSPDSGGWGDMVADQAPKNFERKIRLLLVDANKRSKALFVKGITPSDKFTLIHDLNKTISEAAKLIEEYKIIDESDYTAKAIEDFDAIIKKHHPDLKQHFTDEVDMGGAEAEPEPEPAAQLKRKKKKKTKKTKKKAKII
jgi:hypothetical protein